MKKSADVVIIGAGVIGCSTAYHLAKSGSLDIAVLEMDQVGAGSSSKSAAMLSLQFAHDKEIAQMAKYSYGRYMEFEDEINSSVDFKKIGWMSIASDDGADRLLRRAATLASLGIETEILTPEEVKKVYPELEVNDVVVGTWGSDDGSFDPHMIMWGYIRRAKELGVRLHEGVKAYDLDIRNGSIKGVTTSEGYLATKIVVNAGGPWAQEIGSWAGLEIPILNSARTIIVTDVIPDIPATRPFVEDVEMEWYFRPEGDGLLIGMGDKRVSNLDVQLDQEMVVEIIRVATQRVPSLEQARLLTSWTGIRPLTPDEKPIVGSAPSIEGLLLSCGWGGMGFILAPVAGELIAEYIHEGAARTFDINSLTIERFT